MSAGSFPVGGHCEYLKEYTMKILLSDKNSNKIDSITFILLLSSF